MCIYKQVQDIKTHLQILSIMIMMYYIINNDVLLHNHILCHASKICISALVITKKILQAL